jgi:hypothetical protein
MGLMALQPGLDRPPYRRRGLGRPRVEVLPAHRVYELSATRLVTTGNSRFVSARSFAVRSQRASVIGHGLCLPKLVGPPWQFKPLRSLWRWGAAVIRLLHDHCSPDRAGSRRF